MVIELLAGTIGRGRGGIAAGEDDMRQTYTVKHIRKGLTLLSSAGTMRLDRGGIVAVEDDTRQAYTVKHIRKGLTLLGSDLFASLLNLWW